MIPDFSPRKGMDLLLDHDWLDRVTTIACFFVFSVSIHGIFVLTNAHSGDYDACLTSDYRIIHPLCL